MELVILSRPCLSWKGNHVNRVTDFLSWKVKKQRGVVGIRMMIDIERLVGSSQLRLRRLTKGLASAGQFLMHSTGL